jgi:hypothetical protein
MYILHITSCNFPIELVKVNKVFSGKKDVDNVISKIKHVLELPIFDKILNIHRPNVTLLSGEGKIPFIYFYLSKQLCSTNAD